MPIKTENANRQYIVNTYYFKVVTDVQAELSIFCNFQTFLVSLIPLCESSEKR